MTTSFAMLTLDEIEAHIHNVRRKAEADPEMVESIRIHGLLEPVIVAPFGDGYRLIAGHRRKDGAAKAGLTHVPALIRTDLETEAQQIEAMLIENGHRQDLTAVEEADGYEQLELFGYKPRDIARATGRSEKTVRSRLKLRNLSTDTRTKVHDGQVSVHDALELLEFTDTPAILEDLEAAVGTPNFRYKLQQAQQRRAEHEKQMQLRSRVAMENIPEAPLTGQHWNPNTGPYPLTWFGYYQTTAAGVVLAEEAAHDGCLAWTEKDGKVQLTCSNPAGHRPAAEDEPKTDPEAEARRQEQREEWERERAAREEARQAQAAAAAVRFDHAVQALGQEKVPAVVLDLVQHLLPSWAMSRQRYHGDIPILVTQALGYTGIVDDADQLARDAIAWTPQQLTAALAALLVSEAEDVLECGDFRHGDTGDARALDLYFRWLTDTDHTFCDVDNDLRDEVEHALTAETEDEDDAEAVAS